MRTTYRSLDIRGRATASLTSDRMQTNGHLRTKLLLVEKRGQITGSLTYEGSLQTVWHSTTRVQPNGYLKAKLVSAGHACSAAYWIPEGKAPSSPAKSLTPEDHQSSHQIVRSSTFHPTIRPSTIPRYPPPPFFSSLLLSGLKEAGVEYFIICMYFMTQKKLCVYFNIDLTRCALLCWKLCVTCTVKSAHNKNLKFGLSKHIAYLFMMRYVIDSL